MCVYRPGRIAGDSRSGAWNPDDVSCRVFLGCLELGCAPDLEAQLDATPVDHVSGAIVALSRQVESRGKTFHLVHPRPTSLRAVFDWARARGFPLRRVGVGEWRRELARVIGSAPEHPLYPLLPLLLEDGLEGPEEAAFLPDVRLPPLDSTNTRAGLERAGLAAPPLDEALFDRYLAFFERRGLLPVPASASE